MRILFFPAACFYLGAIYFSFAADDVTKISREEALSFRDKKAQEWKSRFRPGQGRLYYPEERWTKEIARVLELKGKPEKWRRDLYEMATRISSSAAQTYQSPQERVSPKMTLLTANEEGWQRGVGNDIICLSTAVKLWPEERFRKALRERVLQGCRYPTWGRGKDEKMIDQDLAAGHMLTGISIAYDWHKNLFSDEEKKLIRSTIEVKGHRMLEGLYGQAFWASWYSQNHNHICVAGLGLAGLAFYEELAEAPEWLAASMINFERVMDTMSPDGSSVEGVPYWGYGRMAMLLFIEGTRDVTRSDAFYEKDSLLNSVPFRVACSNPGLDGVLMWADSRNHDVYGPQHLLVKLASQYKQGEGQYLAEKMETYPASGAQSLPWMVLWYDPGVKAEVPKELDYHATSWDVLVSRSGWGDADYLFSLKSGVNRDHHTHLDAGSISLNFGGSWLLMAPGYGLGMGEPDFFNMRNGGRWKFFSNSTESHTTLRVNGKNQRSDEKAMGNIDHYLSGVFSMWAEADLKEAYEDVSAIRRKVFHRRGEYVLVLDTVTAEKPISVEWLAQVPPRGEARGNSIWIEGGKGSLRLSLLDSKSRFEGHKPTSPVVDVSPDRMKTLVSKTSGTLVQMGALLEPCSVAEKEPKLKTSFEKSDKGMYVSIEGEDWKDEIWTGGETEAMPLAGVDAKMGGIAIRRKGGHISWISAIAARNIHFNDLNIIAMSPTDIAVETVSPRIFVLTLGKAFQGEIRLPGGMKLFKGNNAVTLDKQAVLEKGRYWILSPSASPKDAEGVCAALFPPRSSASLIQVLDRPALYADAPSDMSVKWEAEDSPIQKYGYSPVKTYELASGGKGISSFGLESPTHRIEWVVNIPQDGNYHLRLRYAIGQPDAHFVLLIDGKSPSSEALNVKVEGDKGGAEAKEWEIRNQNWREAILGSKGAPLKIPLSRGEHRIGIAFPSEGMNLDSWELAGASR